MTEMRNDAQDPSDEVDALAREVLRNDLPPEVEARLERCVERFVESRAASTRLPWWGLPGASQWAVSQRTFVAAAALLLAFGFGLEASSDPGALTESLLNLSASAALLRSIRTASFVTCTGLPDAELVSPGALADRVHRQWVLVQVVNRPDAVVSKFRALDEPAHYQLESDDLSQPPREIRKIPLAGAMPGQPTTVGYDARCIWEVPRTGPPGLVLIVGR